MLRASGERELAEISSPSYRVSIILTDSMTYSLAETESGWGSLVKREEPLPHRLYRRWQEAMKKKKMEPWQKA